MKRGALLLFLTLVACQQAPETEPVAVRAPVAVRVAPVRRGEINRVITATGETAALNVVRLASPVAGRVTMLTLRPGDNVGRGTVAARVVPLENDAALHGFQMLADARALHGDEARLAQRLQGDLKQRDIGVTAPFNGVVAERLHNPNEQVAANDVLLEIYEPDSLYVLAQVALPDAGALRPGMATQIQVGGATLAGQVDTILGAMNPQTLTVPVRIKFATPLLPALLHAAVVCRITVEAHGNANLIPRAALLPSATPGEDFVMVPTAGRAVRRLVRIGLRTDQEVEVLDGLQPDELVVLDGQYALPDGTAIAPQPDAE